jgi:hypothetical protein
MYAMCLGLVTHPPAPSQKEGEILLVKLFLSTHTFSNLNLYERGLPFPLGRGRGLGCIPHTHPPPPHTPRQQKAQASRYFVLCHLYLSKPGCEILHMYNRFHTNHCPYLHPRIAHTHFIALSHAIQPKTTTLPMGHGSTTTCLL